MTRTFESLRRLATLPIAITLLTSSAAAAQTPASSPPAGAAAQTVFLASPAFARLVEGKQVWITTSDGTRSKNHVVTLSSTSITVAGSTARTVPFDQIVKVESVTHTQRNRVLKGALIGFGSGFGGMGLLLASCWGDECEPNLGPAFAWGGVGAGVGAAIGALVNLGHRNENVLYESGRPTTTMALAPILSPTRNGLAFSMTWR